MEVETVTGIEMEMGMNVLVQKELSKLVDKLVEEQDKNKALQERLLEEMGFAASWMNKYDARQDAIRIAEQRIKTLEDALLEIARHNLGIHKTALSCAISLIKTHTVKEPKAACVVCECGVTILGEFATDGDGNPICSICLSEAAKESKTACNCVGCNPANYPETNGWKCGMHTERGPK